MSAAVTELNILLNDRCNLQCSYCHFRQRDPRRCRELESRQLDHALQLFFGHTALDPTLPRVLCFNADGEVLTSRALLLWAVERAARLRDQLGAVALTVAVVTNGTLVDEEVASRLARCGAVVTVSIDGAADAHDRHRRGADGDPTHEAVLAGIGRLRAAGVPLSFRAVVTEETAPALAETHGFLQRLGPARPIKLRPVRRSTGAPFPPAWVSRYGEHYLERVRQLLDTGATSDALPDDALHFVRFAADGVVRPSYCNAGRSMLWLAPTGELSCCGLLTGAEHALGVVDELERPRDLEHLLARGARGPLARPLPRRCRGCDWRDACAGGCPALAQLDGDAEGLNPLCSFYAALGALVAERFPPARRGR